MNKGRSADHLLTTLDHDAGDSYRGWDIYRSRWPDPEWIALSPNYDASYEGPEDGWVDNGEKADGRTREELIAEIDRWFEENGA